MSHEKVYRMKSVYDLSIIIPVYNAMEYLLDLINNIYNSYFGIYSYEVVVVNDGSKDESLEYLSRVEKERDNFKVITQENKGPSIARKTGFENSCGRYIVFIDCDDKFENKFFFNLLQAAEDRGCDIVESGYNLICDDKITAVKPCDTRNDEPVLKFLHNKTSMFLWDKIFKRELFRDTIFVPFYYSEDAVLLLQLYRNAKKVGTISDVLYDHYIRKSSLTGSYNVRMIDQVKSGLKMLEIAKDSGLPYCITTMHYTCKYAAKNCINMKKAGLTQTKEYDVAKKAFKDNYVFFGFLKLFFKREVTFKSVIGIICFRAFGK